MTDRPTTMHSLRRTSPKGPGQKFIGTCILCGAENLTVGAMSEECPNQRGLTQNEALLHAVQEKNDDA